MDVENPAGDCVNLRMCHGLACIAPGSGVVCTGHVLIVLLLSCGLQILRSVVARKVRSRLADSNVKIMTVESKRINLLAIREMMIVAHL